MPVTADQYTNYGSSSVAGGASGRGTPLQASDTTLYLPIGDGAKFPALSGSQTFRVQIAPTEIAICTARAGDVLTITRGAEGTTATTALIGTSVQLAVTAAEMANLFTAINTGREFIVTDNTYGATGNGSTDDTTAIQAAITACQNAGGGIVYLPPGTYKTSASLVVTADNVKIRGAGIHATIIKPAASATFDVISTGIPGVQGASGYIRNYLAIEQLTIDGSNMTGTVAGQGNGIHWYGVRFSTIRDCLFLNQPNWAILCDGDNTGPGNNFSYNLHISRCIFDLGTGGNIYFTNSEAGNVVECEFKYAGAACAAAQPTFSSPDTVAMHLRAGSGYLYAAGNVFGSGGTYTTECIRLSNSGPCRIIGNRFDQPRYQAIYTPAGNHIIANNQIGNASKVGTVEAIRLASDNNVVIGNKFDITNGAAHWTYCVLEAGGPWSSNIIAENEMVTGTSGFVSLNATSTARVHHNSGYNPVGQVTAPTFPATTVGVINNTGVDVTAYIANGTGAITVVSVAGIGGSYVATGIQIAASGYGVVRIPSGGAVKFTYASGTPTWVWMGE